MTTHPAAVVAAGGGAATHSVIATELVVCVTGHRDPCADEVAGIGDRVRGLFASLRHEFPQLQLTVMSAWAQGGHQLVAREALACGARMVALLPLPPEVHVDDFVDAQVRNDFDALLEVAEIVQLPLPPGIPQHAVEAPGNARDRQYTQAGIHISSHCHPRMFGRARAALAEHAEWTLMHRERPLQQGKL